VVNLGHVTDLDTYIMTVSALGVDIHRRDIAVFELGASHWHPAGWSAVSVSLCIHRATASIQSQWSGL